MTSPVWAGAALYIHCLARAPGRNGRTTVAIRLFILTDEPGSRRLIGQLTEAQLRFLVDELEEGEPRRGGGGGGEGRTGARAPWRAYYLDDGTLEVLEEAGADPELMQLLRQATAIGHPFRDAAVSEAPREGVEIAWESDEDVDLP